MATESKMCNCDFSTERANERLKWLPIFCGHEFLCHNGGACNFCFDLAASEEYY